MKAFALLISAVLLAAGNAYAVPDAVNDDDVLPNSPWKEQGQPDAGRFNPAGGHEELAPAVVVVPVAPAAMTYYPPAIVITERPRKPYALVAAPTLPCAPAYCPRRVRVDRN